jgi:hypothetical protein
VFGALGGVVVGGVVGQRGEKAQTMYAHVSK